ncbi:MAG: hypothetical protein ACLUEQ_08345 [Cloacibacillus evryensis]
MWDIRTEDVDATVLSEDKKLFGLLGSTYKIEIRPFARLLYQVLPFRQRDTRTRWNLT